MRASSAERRCAAQVADFLHWGRDAICHV